MDDSRLTKSVAVLLGMVGGKRPSVMLTRHQVRRTKILTLMTKTNTKTLSLKTKTRKPRHLIDNIHATFRVECKNSLFTVFNMRQSYCARY